MSEFEHSPEYREAMRRVFDLRPAEQMRALEALRDFLGAAGGAETSLERELQERAEALDMIRAAAEHLALPSGKAPTTAQFDRAMRELGSADWTSARVGRAWVKWSFACDAFRGERPRLSAAQRAIRRRHSGKGRTHEAHLDGIRQWLGTEPAMTRATDYDNWAREKNEQLGTADLPVSSSASIRKTFGFDWRDIVSLARGEIDEADARNRPRKHSGDWIRGPHRLVARRGVGVLLGMPPGSVNSIVNRIEFPPPAATIGGQRVWLEEDVRAFKRGAPPLEREENALQRLYMDSHEVANALGVKPTSMMNKGYGPPIAGYIGHRKIWLRAEVEAWVRDNPNTGSRSVARKRRGRSSPPGSGSS